MFPMEFDYRILSTLPLPTAERAKSVSQLLRVIVLKRVMPYFRNERGTDPLKLAHVAVSHRSKMGNLMQQIGTLKCDGCSCLYEQDYCLSAAKIFPSHLRFFVLTIAWEAVRS